MKERIRQMKLDAARLRRRRWHCRHGRRRNVPVRGYGEHCFRSRGRSSNSLPAFCVGVALQRVHRIAVTEKDSRHSYSQTDLLIEATVLADLVAGKAEQHKQNIAMVASKRDFTMFSFRQTQRVS